ncbi:MAG: electron transfer flavoprotein subunit beta/FixA family protein [Gemmatimonadetes bacterium]|nr:electron transfer flavoprotein subunit beta/FixA family protein [Gemmatimonadota bacterium]
MNITVCVRRVPDTETRIKIAPDGKGIDPTGVKFVLNPYDEFAVEEALRLKEQAGQGTLTAVTLGGEAAKETLRTVLAMGADQAVLLKGEPSFDGLGTAEILAEYLKDRPLDLVFFGKQAIDDDNMQVPAMVAELLELPCVTVVVELQRKDGVWHAKREVEGGHEIVEFTTPAVIAAQKGLNEPRYPSLKGIMAAKKKPLEEVEVGTAESRVVLERLTPPPERKGPVFIGEGPEAVSELVRRLREEAKVL